MMIAASDSAEENMLPSPSVNSAPEILDAVILSDIHLGSSNSQAAAVAQLLGRIHDVQMPTRMLIINGDVFDSIDFRRLRKRHWKVLSLIRRLSDKIEVIWIAGNHDGPAEIISNLLGVRVMAQYVLESGQERILILHGHQFDKFVLDHPILTWIADCLYAVLQKIDRTHYVARLAKRQTKVFLRCERKVRHATVAHAHQLGCGIAVCGHTHHAVAEEEEQVRYYNSGCWTEKPCHYLTVVNGAVNLCSWNVDTEDDAPAEEDQGIRNPIHDSAFDYFYQTTNTAR